MARYSREFLVPYLQNICALHLAIEKIDQIVYDKESIIKKYLNPGKILPPREPKYESESIGWLGYFGIFLIVISGMTLLQDDGSPYGIESSLKVVLIIFIILGAFLVGSAMKESRRSAACNSTAREQYEKKMEAYRASALRAEVKNQERIREIPRIKKEIAVLDTECDKAEEYLKLLYSANIIPGKYRDLYAAVYLYDWFSTSGADDMDHALSMYVLEEIKSRLDKIIENQSEIILNQRIAIANQQRSIKMQEDHNQMMRRKLDRLQATEEERLKYDKMIEGNTAANAFFAAANYLK